MTRLMVVTMLIVMVMLVVICDGDAGSDDGEGMVI